MAKEKELSFTDKLEAFNKSVAFGMQVALNLFALALMAGFLLICVLIVWKVYT